MLSSLLHPVLEGPMVPSGCWAGCFAVSPVQRLLPQLGVGPRSFLTLCTLFLAPLISALVGVTTALRLDFLKQLASLEGQDAPGLGH